MISPTSVCYVSSWQSPQNTLEKHKVWNKPFMCTKEQAGTQSSFPVCVTLRPLPSISFPRVWLWTCTCNLRPVQTLFSWTQLDTEFICSTTTYGETIQPLLENMFVFHWSMVVHNGKSRMPSDSFAFFPVSVDNVHLVTTMNIAILLCRRMWGMWAAVLLSSKYKDSGSRWRKWPKKNVH